MKSQIGCVCRGYTCRLLIYDFFCRGLILLHPFGDLHIWGLLKRVSMSSNIVVCQKGVMELDPYIGS